MAGSVRSPTGSGMVASSLSCPASRDVAWGHPQHARHLRHRRCRALGLTTPSCATAANRSLLHRCHCYCNMHRAARQAFPFFCIRDVGRQAWRREGLGVAAPARVSSGGAGGRGMAAPAALACSNDSSAKCVACVAGSVHSPPDLCWSPGWRQNADVSSVLCSQLHHCSMPA